jgi:hypothetical protein
MKFLRLTFVPVRTPLWVLLLELPLPDLLGLSETTSKDWVWPKAQHAQTTAKLAWRCFRLIGSFSVMTVLTPFG